MNWITDQIAIGNFIDALDVEVLRQFQSVLGLTSLLSDLKSGNVRALPFLRDAFEELDDDRFAAKMRGVLAHLESRRVEVFDLVDGPGNDFDTFRRAIDTLHDLATLAPPVLVHCHAGRSRSAVVVAGFIMKTRGIGPVEALEFVSSKRETYVDQSLAALLDRL